MPDYIALQQKTEIEPKVLTFLGVDPGASGGLAMVTTDGQVTCGPSARTDRDLWNLLKDCGADYAVIEQQTARPTVYFDKSTGRRVSTVLASTVSLFGSYRYLEGLLVACEIPYEAVPPQRWQKGLHIQPREKSETTTQWKNRLKAKAQSCFPKTVVTLATADALLLALYAQRTYGGNNRE